MDFRPYLQYDSQDAQLNDQSAPVPDRFENCTFAVARSTMADYGFGRPLTDQQWREIATPNYHMGEGWQATVDVVNARPDLFPNPPSMSIEFPGDVMAFVHEQAAQGFICHVGFWCTTNAEYIITPQQYSHAWKFAYTGTGGWNPWTGYFVEHDDGFWAQAYDQGGVLVFKRSVLPAPPETPWGIPLNAEFGPIALAVKPR